MDQMIGRCGLVCTECPAHIGTRNDDMGLIERTAKQWSEEFGHPFTAEDVRCDGCLSEGGQLCSYCSQCGIRKCVMARELDNCARCDEYACEQLEAFLGMAPEARKSLEQIRGS